MSIIALMSPSTEEKKKFFNSLKNFKVDSLNILPMHELELFELNLIRYGN